jgi:hypothetical protein
MKSSKCGGYGDDKKGGERVHCMIRKTRVEHDLGKFFNAPFIAHTQWNSLMGKKIPNQKCVKTFISCGLWL